MPCRLLRTPRAPLARAGAYPSSSVGTGSAAALAPLARAGAYPSSACHCEERGSRPATWQSASPAQGVHCGNVFTNVATPPPFACHCEPVRTLVWQSVTPQGNLASWQYLGQIRSFYVFAGNSCVLLCAAARRTDCRVALLLAMTCRRLLRCYVCRRVQPDEFAAACGFAW